MSAHTINNAYVLDGACGADGRKIVAGTLTGSSSYDTGGSVVDLSDYLNATNGQIDMLMASCDSGDYLFSADIVGVATSKLMAFGLSYVDVSYAAGGALFDASATSDTTTWEQPANTVLRGARLTLDEQFAAPSLSNMTVTIGDGSDADGILAGSANLTSATPGVMTTTLGALFVDAGGYHATAATNLTLTATATGADMDALTAGQITVRYYYAPGDAYTLGDSNSELISTFDLSGETIRFMAIGKDA